MLQSKLTKWSVKITITTTLPYEKLIYPTFLFKTLKITMAQFSLQLSKTTNRLFNIVTHCRAKKKP